MVKMEKQKLSYVKKWLNQIPQDNEGNEVTDDKTQRHFNSVDMKIDNDESEIKPVYVPTKSHIDNYKCYSISTLCFGLMLWLNGAVLTPLGFVSSAYLYYYPFKIFGPLFLTLGMVCLTLSSVFYCKKRLMTRRRMHYWQDSSSFGRTDSSVGVQDEQERNRYKWGGVIIMVFGALLIVNGAIVTPLGVSGKRSNVQIEGFGPVIIIIGLVFIVVSGFLFRGMRRISITRLRDVEKLRTKVAFVSPNDAKVELLGNVDSNNKSSTIMENDAESSYSSYIWLKIDKGVLNPK